METNSEHIFIYVAFCVVSGSPRYTLKWCQRKGPFPFLIHFIRREWWKMDSKRHWEELRRRNAYRTLAQRRSAGGLSRSLTWAWKTYRRFRIFAALCWIRAVLDLYRKSRQRQPIPVRIPRPHGNLANRWSFWSWPSHSVISINKTERYKPYKCIFH